MPEFKYPGVYVEEIPAGVHSIPGVPTSTTGFVGRAEKGPLITDPTGAAATVCSFAEYERLFGKLSPAAPMGYAIRDFFAGGGTQAVIARLLSGKNEPLTPQDYVRAFVGGALDKVEILNLLCIPPDNIDVPTDTDPSVWAAAADYCVRRRAMLIVDPPMAWADNARQGNFGPKYMDPAELGVVGENARNAAVYFPRVMTGDVMPNGEPRILAPCGIIAGVMAKTDATRGVWKAPAGTDAGLTGVLGLEINLTDDQNGVLNPLGINCLRSFPVYGPVVWGSRTLRGADIMADDYKYIMVRRLALYIEESIYRDTRWAAFEPNDETLWTSLRLTVGNFLLGLQHAGAFYSFFVHCDNSTTSIEDIENGVVNTVIGFAPLQPAEFVVLYIQQIAGQSSEKP